MSALASNSLIFFSKSSIFFILPSGLGAGAGSFLGGVNSGFPQILGGLSLGVPGFSGPIPSGGNSLSLNGLLSSLGLEGGSCGP